MLFNQIYQNFYKFNINIKHLMRDFPGSSVVKILPFSAGAGGFFSFL